MAHLYIFLTIALTVYSQLIIKSQVNSAGVSPPDLIGKLTFLGHLLLNPWVVSGIACSFCSGLTWMLAMSRFSINYAYPFIGLNFVLIPLFSYWLFQDAITAPKAIGVGLIVLGIIVSSQG